MRNLILNAGRYNKFIVAILGVCSTALTAFAHTQAWVPTVLAAISALSIYLVPNTPASS